MRTGSSGKTKTNKGPSRENLGRISYRTEPLTTSRVNASRGTNTLLEAMVGSHSGGRRKETRRRGTIGGGTSSKSRRKK